MIRKQDFPPADRLEHVYGHLELGADGAPTERWRKRTVSFVRTPWPFRLTWAPEVTVHRLPCHRQVTGPLQDALAAIGEEFSREEIVAAGLDLFGGSQFFALEDRKREPGDGRRDVCATLSPHVWGAAFVLPGLGGEAKASRRALELFLEAGWSWDPGRARIAAMSESEGGSSAVTVEAGRPSDGDGLQGLQSAAGAAESSRPAGKPRRR